MQESLWWWQCSDYKVHNCFRREDGCLCVFVQCWWQSMCVRSVLLYVHRDHKDYRGRECVLNCHNCFHCGLLFTAFHNCPSEGRVFHHRLPALRRCPQRGPDRVPDQPGALPTYPLPSCHLRSRHLRREGLPRAAVGVRDHQCLLRALQPGTLSKQCSAEVGLASDRKARRNTDAGSIPTCGKGFFSQASGRSYGARTVPVCSPMLRHLSAR